MKRLELKVGQASRYLEFIMGDARIMYAGMISEKVFSVVVIHDCHRHSHSYNLYFSTDVSEIIVNEYNVIRVESVTPEKIIIVKK